MGFTLKPPEASWPLLAGHAYPLSKWKDDFRAGKWNPGLLGGFEKGWFEWSSGVEPCVDLHESSAPWLGTAGFVTAARGPGVGRAWAPAASPQALCTLQG